MSNESSELVKLAKQLHGRDPEHVTRFLDALKAERQRIDQAFDDMQIRMKTLGDTVRNCLKSRDLWWDGEED